MKGGRRLEWQIWDVVDPAEEFLGRVRRRWKPADHNGEQDVKKDKCSPLKQQPDRALEVWWDSSGEARIGPQHPGKALEILQWIWQIEIRKQRGTGWYHSFHLARNITRQNLFLFCLKKEVKMSAFQGTRQNCPSFTIRKRKKKNSLTKRKRILKENQFLLKLLNCQFCFNFPQ